MTTTTAATDQSNNLSGERADLLDSLAKVRHFLRFTTRELTDEQATTRTTASELTLAGLIKHVTQVERNWANFIVEGPAAMAKDGKDFIDWTEEDFQEYADGFRMLPGETLAGLLGDYAKVAARTDALLAELPSLDAVQPLPKAPWSTETERTARGVFLHIVHETAQHSGHADIIRESLDGAKSMG